MPPPGSWGSFGIGTPGTSTARSERWCVGIRLVEVTLDTPGALDAVERGRRSGWSIGTGTVLAPHQVNRCVDAGAAFVMSPGIVRGVIEGSLELGVDVVPGASTPTEVMRAHGMGVNAVKLFPASLGGPAYIRSLLGPLTHVPLVPTGGIAIQEVPAYLAADAASVGLGGAAMAATSDRP
jgi:2-dehydro-3-deoxyphosphogluconate aldolase/(4S)-4-hydroxy-2-oxoglutarate aldolase